jgi:glycosyltransferase involved in cell wall biosynthesis
MMPALPLVSIVTPTFDRAPLLRHTMASVRRQTYPNIEHVVVDGGSNDGTLDLLRAEEGSYPLRWISEPDEGMYHAINKGLRMARGDILAYLNSDDLYLPWTIETVVEAFERHPEAGFVFGDALAVDDEDGRTQLYLMLPFDLDYVRRAGFIAQPAVFWRRRVFEDVGPLDERIRYVADCDYWMRSGASHRFVKVNEFLAVERNHDATLREALAEKVWPEVEQVRSRYVRLEGRRHRRLMLRHDVRSRLYYRLYWLLFLVQATLPPALRLPAWRRMLDSGHLEIHRLRLLLRMTPRLGRRLEGTVLAPSRHWLEPDGSAATAPAKGVGP